MGDCWGEMRHPSGSATPNLALTVPAGDGVGMGIRVVEVGMVLRDNVGVYVYVLGCKVKEPDVLDVVNGGNVVPLMTVLGSTKQLDGYTMTVVCCEMPPTTSDDSAANLYSSFRSMSPGVRLMQDTYCRCHHEVEQYISHVLFSSESTVQLGPGVRGMIHAHL